MGNFRYRSWKQLRPVTTLITVAEHEYVVENDMYAVFYPHTVAMLRYCYAYRPCYAYLMRRPAPLALVTSSEVPFPY